MPKQEFIRKLTKKGKYSYALILPKEIIDQYHWRERQKLVIQPYGKNKIIVRDWKSKDN